MKKLLAIVLVLGVAGSAWAGGSCCSKKSKDAAKSGDSAMSQCEGIFDSLGLSTDQKAKISSIQEACEKEGDSKESCSKYMGQIRDVLTPDQRMKFDAELSKADQQKTEEAKPNS